MPGNKISLLLLSLLCWPKVIILSGRHCIMFFSPGSINSLLDCVKTFFTGLDWKPRKQTKCFDMQMLYYLVYEDCSNCNNIIRWSLSHRVTKCIFQSPDLTIKEILWREILTPFMDAPYKGNFPQMMLLYKSGSCEYCNALTYYLSFCISLNHWNFFTRSSKK